ncbi:uncharacterized protein LOC131214134 [Anopheles bellator]|uniref:uncharacterized protein LOC131214134 n=1 Tax=Anopheles bellator TaxID=139047 RepID=UPI0026485EAB|nr:uncharacterized protein LOC131214134 [Anopheles bellator]
MENTSSLERFKDAFSEEQVIQIPEELERLERHKEDFFAAMAKFEELDDSTDAIDVSITNRIEFEERYRSLKSFLRERQRKDSSHDLSGMANSTLFAYGRSNASNLRLPKIELPTFDGDCKKWLSFRDRFVAMIDASTELPSIAKLQYLLSSLSGEAAVPFEHVSLTTENYAITWATLLRRYDNRRMLIREYYQKLHHLPAVQSECANDLVKLVDGFSRLVHGLQKLNVPVDSWNTPLSNLLLLKLDDATIQEWEKHSVHFAKDVYSDLVRFIEDRIQILKATTRFNEEGSRVSSKAGSPIKVAGGRNSASRRTLANAAMAKTDTDTPRAVQQPQCALRCLDSHLLRTCSVFKSKDVQDRRKVVSANGLCWNCLSPSHQVKQCRSEYSCRLCRERHHTLLHFTTGSARVTMSVQSDDDMVFLETVWLTLIDDYEPNTKRERY